ncbi:hypothetical protein B0T26DRAFT_717669 [Lasiosphaeria miniovina]|uniref:Uncharacterized protein n=1 Tax=Lasiosphaeria miniovina TaxID=1954250 RepID=A0AA40AD72_9PEZI|nr:uncharacterized protein B0T26DRAFT_717669 [Lasiosphaeria miniovina]KAK0713518.1 hypothetical protein B0T26DRAFT_717669 [Lasiosphaeria miniovina]
MFISKVSCLCLALSAAAIYPTVAFPDNVHLEKRQDWDPKGILCNVDRDCTSPGYPYCRCGNIFFGGTVGTAPTFMYLCASHCGANGCIPNCGNCQAC